MAPPLPDPPVLADEVRRLLARFAARDAADLADDLPLGPEGLGLDSVALVEVLLVCESRFGVPLAPELLETGALTVGELARRVAAAAGPRR